MPALEVTQRSRASPGESTSGARPNSGAKASRSQYSTAKSRTTAYVTAARSVPAVVVIEVTVPSTTAASPRESAMPCTIWSTRAERLESSSRSVSMM